MSKMDRFAQKLESRLSHLMFVGRFSYEEAESKQLRLVVGRGQGVVFYWLVDENDGTLVDVKFQAYGPLSLILVAEMCSEVLLRKNYDQASRVSADLIDRQGRDHSHQESFPPSAAPFFNAVLQAVEEAVQQCQDIPFVAVYDQSPVYLGDEAGECIAEWHALSQELQKTLIEEILDKEIRPYVELDAGGVQLVDLKEGREVMIAYQGSCTSCYSATGSTLQAIEKLLQSRIHPSLFVTPQL